MSRFSQDDYLFTSEHGVKWFVGFEGDDWHIGAEQDCTALIEANKASQTSGHTGWSEDKSMRLKARVPAIVQIEWMNKFGIDMMDPDHADGVKRLLNSSDYRYLNAYEWTL